MPIDFNAVNKAGTGAPPPSAHRMPPMAAPLEPEVMAASDPATVEAIKAQMFNVEAIKTLMAPHHKMLDDLAAQAKALVIDSDESNERAVETLGLVKKTARAVDNERKAIVDEPSTFVRSVNGLAKGIQDKLSAVERTIKNKASLWAQEQERKRQEAERQAREEARRMEEQRRREEEAERKRLEAEQRKLDEEKAQADAAERKRLEAEQRKLDEEKAAAQEAAAAPIQAPAMPEAEAVTRTAHGSAHTRKTWVFEIEDVQDVPREFLTVDEKAIREAVKGGTRKIPGVRIYQKTDMTVRI